MKKILRQELKAKRRSMTESTLIDHSQRLIRLLATLLQSKPTCTIGLYYPLPGEVNVMPLLEHCDLQEFNWALPVCQRQLDTHFLRFASYNAGESLQTGDYGIPIPQMLQWVDPEIVIVPCLGANRAGYRLGYGAGWYDKTLAQMSNKPQTVAVLWADALLEDEFQETHDQPMDVLVTPFEVLKPVR